MDDLEVIHTILDVELVDADSGSEHKTLPAERESWLRWTVASYEELPLLHQPPYGERAMVLRATGELIGACGYAPCLTAFGQIPALAPGGIVQPPGITSPEVGLFWAVSPRHQRQGYATEAAAALIEHAFTSLQLHRIVATTAYENAASMRVMEKVGMSIERNPLPEPPWLQVVGVIYHP